MCVTAQVYEKVGTWQSSLYACSVLYFIALLSMVALDFILKRNARAEQKELKTKAADMEITKF